MAEKREESFERMLAKLEVLVSEMEAGTLELNVLMKKFDEGKKLVELCGKRLADIQNKIEKLTPNGREPLDV